MIGGRSGSAVMSVVLAVGATGLCFGLRSPSPAGADPPAAAGRAVELARALNRADAAIDSMIQLLESSVEEARRGAALAVAGNEPPAPPLRAAADRLEPGLATVDEAQRAMAALAGVAAATAPTLQLPELAADRAAVTSIASQLRDAAGAATEFVERRHSADIVLQALQDGVAAVEGNDPHAALDRIDEARAAFEVLTSWAQPPAALAVWLGTTHDLIDATAAIAGATISGDQPALDAARIRYADAAAATRQADSALAIALAEGGSATTSVPLRRLASLLASAAAVRASLASMLAQPVPSPG